MDVSYFHEIHEDRLGTPNKATFKWSYENAHK